MTHEETVQTCKEHTLFSWSAQGTITNPLSMSRSEGIYFWDLSGKKYIDFSSQLMNMNIGHQHPKVIEAIKNQADKLCFAYPGIVTEARAETAKKLADITPGDLNKFFFGLGGADSIENAMKMARMFTGRHKIITKYRSYHGGTMGAATAGGDPRRIGMEPMISGIVRVQDPYCYQCPFGQKGPESCKRECVSHLEDIIQLEGPNTIAAVLMEGVSGSSGILLPPEDYWPSVKKICDKYGILTISDEVMSGFGRTGEWFGIDNYKVVPDIMVMAKGLTCGYVPLSAVAVSDKISKFFDDRVLQCGLTYSCHPIGLAAASATLDVYKEEGLIDNSKNMGKIQTELLQNLKKNHPSVGDVRNIGLFGVIEVVKNRETREKMAPFNATGAQMETMNKVGAFLKEKGLITFVRWNYIFTVPPLCINKTQLEEAFAIIDESLKIADSAVN